MMLKIIRGRHFFCTGSQCSTNKLLLTRNRTALTEVNNAVCGSTIQWRGRSHAASVPSESSKTKRVQKKVSKDERRAMMESFVNNYRATHDGKFPSVTDALKRVGGSFYVIRTILQELEYKSKVTCSARGTQKILGVGLTRKNKVMVDEESQNEHHTVVAMDVEIVNTNDKHLEAEGGSLASSVARRTLFEEIAKPAVPDGESGREDSKKEAEGVSSNFVASEAHILKGETEEVSYSCFENADEKEEEIVSDNLLDSDDVKHKDKQFKGSSEPEKNAVEIANQHANDEDIPKKSTMWGNLKSLADGFINMWRKL